jgi:hypothetical protein
MLAKNHQSWTQYQDQTGMKVFISTHMSDEYKLGMGKKEEKVIDYRDQTRQLVCSKVDTRATVVQNQLIIHQNNPYFNTLPEQIKGLMLRIRTTHFETNKQHMTGLSSTSNTHHPPTHHNVHTTKLTHIMQ